MRENSKVKATQALFLTAGTEILASSRTRVYQYLPYLEKEGIGHKVINFASGRQCQANTMKLIRSPLGLVLDKIYNFFQVLKFLFYAKGYDVIFIQKILLPKPLQSALRFLNSHIVFDFDDAIFIKDLYKTDKFSGRFIQMLSQSKYIILENDFTKDFVQKYNKNIMMITGPIDTNRYPLRKQTNNNRGLTIGWIGSQDTLNYLQMLYPVFQTLANKYNDLKIEVIGASKIEIDGINLLVKDWSLDTEVSNLSDFDIGVMPLCDDDWSKGKGGYKLLQYMAIGIPCVASPVGVNQKIIREGINGYLAKTQKEWEEKLSRLIEDQDLRLAMGRNGREIAEREYSFEANIERFIAALKRSQCLSDRR